MYRDTLLLGLGCYKLTVEDTDGDGLSFFANNDGSGFFRLWNEGATLILFAVVFLVILSLSMVFPIIDPVFEMKEVLLPTLL